MKPSATIMIIICLALGCKTNQRTVSSQQREVIDIRDFPKEPFVMDYTLFRIASNSFIGMDSLVVTKYPNGNIQVSGSYARNNRGEVTFLRTDDFEMYYENGKLKEKGLYDIGRYTQCCAGGLCSQYYNYKKGVWEYYYENGALYAKVKYKIKEFHIRTSCEGGDKLLFGKVALDESMFWNEDGNQIDPSPELIKKIETVHFRTSEYYIESLSIENDTIRLGYEYVFEEK